ncbi:hypothetical protein Syun_015706 [Stephania yunnanensis]|uniref:Uncharacterized protein n=1 Tax=Stephania yunnanensis TaxID=152371 RepID=A0AAP0PD27_9MAGN
MRMRIRIRVAPLIQRLRVDDEEDTWRELGKSMSRALGLLGDSMKNAVFVVVVVVVGTGTGTGTGSGLRGRLEGSFDLHEEFRDENTLESLSFKRFPIVDDR